MPSRRAPFAAFALAACAAAEVRPRPAPVPEVEAAPATWREVMRDVGARHREVRGALADRRATDLRAVAAAAGDAARLLRLGYGPLEDKSVPGFARSALDAESWLLQVELEARQAHGDIARELFVAGERHCTRCHDDCLRNPG